MAQITLNSTGVASNGSLVLQSNGTTAAVTIDASQNVTLNSGTANGVPYLNGSKVVTSGTALTFDGSNFGIGGAGSYLLDVKATTDASHFQVTSTANANNTAFRIGTDGTSAFINATGGSSGNLQFRVYGTEGMRLTSTGLGIGTSSPAVKVHAYSSTAMGQITADGTGSIKTGINFASGGTTYGQIYFDNNSPYDMSVMQQYSTGSLRFGTNNTERARIDSSGNLLVGTTSATGKITVSTSGNTYGIYSENTNTATTSNYLFWGYASSASRFVVYGNGGIANYSANDVNLSDRREKTNFAPAKSYLDVICSIPVQTYNYIDQNLEEDGGLTLGVVAQDVQAVAPELVMESNWGTDEAPKMRLSIYQTDLQYALMKCIQEQQAIIESLKARLDAANL